MGEKAPLNIVLEEHPRTGRRIAWWVVIALASVVVAAALSAGLTVPVRIVAAVGTAIPTFVLLAKLWRDNRLLFKEASRWRLVKSALLGFLYMIPFSIALAPGVGMNFALDKGAGLAIDFLDTKVAPLIEKKLEEVLEPYPWYDPRHWIGDGMRKTIRETEILRQAPKHWRYGVLVARQFLEAIRVLFTVYLCYVALRLLFYFIARVYVSRGDVVRFTLEARR
jgi:hypothetical protein